MSQYLVLRIISSILGGISRQLGLKTSRQTDAADKPREKGGAAESLLTVIMADRSKSRPQFG
jgi:hypothetical protein